MNISQQTREQIAAINEKLTSLFNQCEVLREEIDEVRADVLDNEESDAKAREALFLAHAECDYATRAIDDVKTALLPLLEVPVAVEEISSEEDEESDDE